MDPRGAHKDSIWERSPGFVLSGGLHVAGILALLINFEQTKTFPDAVESVPVDMVTMSQFDEIMNGEKTAKPMPKPQRRADKVADLEEHKPAPPLAEAKKDTPTDDSPDKPNDDPGHADKPQEAVAPAPPPPEPAPQVPQPVAPPPPPQPVAKAEPAQAEPPPPPVVPPPAPEPPAPLPPERPVVKLEPPAADAPTPPLKPDIKPPPPGAEAIAPTPPPRPKVEPKPDPKPAPKPKLAKVKPVPRPHPVIKEAKLAPEPPPVVPMPPVPPKPEPAKPNPIDRVANLLNAMKSAMPKVELPKVELPKVELPKPAPQPPKRADQPKPVEKARAGNEVREAKAHDDFSLAKISALLDHEPAQRKASTGRQLTQMASLGAPNAHAEHMSPSMRAQLDGWLIDHYRGCWSYFGLGATQDYIPAVHVQMAVDGSLTARPALINPPSDPNLRSLADSALRAVTRCNPMDMPQRFKPFYDSWRDRIVRFDPKELS